MELLIYILLPTIHFQLIYFPQAPTSKLWKQAIFAWKFFFLIKCYNLRPEIPSSVTAGESIKGEARAEEQNPSVTVQGERLLGCGCLQLPSACLAHSCNIWQSMENPPIAQRSLCHLQTPDNTQPCTNTHGSN